MAIHGVDQIQYRRVRKTAYREERTVGVALANETLIRKFKSHLPQCRVGFLSRNRGQKFAVRPKGRNSTRNFFPIHHHAKTMGEDRVSGNRKVLMNLSRNMPALSSIIFKSLKVS